MKYFVSTINDDLRDEIHFKKPLVVTADKDEKAEKSTGHCMRQMTL
ncbi:MAG: hypothetical protein ACLR6B_11720 [Blautia sp.]